MSYNLKDISGFEGLYSISNNGEVWSYPKSGKGGHNGIFLNQYIKDGYPMVGLYRDKKMLNKKVSRLVALTYIENPYNLPVVRHLDNNKMNSRVSNLDWCTYGTNAQQAHDDGLNPNTPAQKEAVKKFNAETKCRPIMQLTKEGILCRIYISSREASRITGLFQSSISRTAKGEQKHCGGYKWQYS